VKEPTNSAINIESLFPFPLDDFQKQAISALNVGKSVVVCAPTGSGKTLIGEYAIYRALQRKKRVFYTTPLKALSNQKFRDFQERFGKTPLNDPENPFLYKEVGLITGDMVINANAPIVVMTTEIFRNMLYETPIGEVGTSLENVETLVLDECHYISDRGRGTVWEESIIYCPPSIQLVALSATIGNPVELTQWINQVRSVNLQNSRCELINSDFRPVPLRFYFSTKDGLFPLLDGKQQKINPNLKNKSKGKGRRIKREDCPSIPLILDQLQQKDMLPAIYVIFSRRGCDGAVKELNGFNLVNDAEAKAIYYRLLLFFFQDNPYLQEIVLSVYAVENPILHRKLLSFFAANQGEEDSLPQYLLDNAATKSSFFQYLATASQLVRSDQVEPLSRGIAAHHAGVLPLWKELVENLFEAGLVKIVFATATLAAGINMPARTTVISALSKRTDEGHSMLTPSEFVQIAGRAGRRGMDAVGHVVTVQTPFEAAKEAAYLATASPEPLKSCFAPTYGMVLNLLQKHTLEEAKDLLESSFAEYLAQLKLTPEQQIITDSMRELARLDIELAGIDRSQIVSYEKLKERLREEERLLKILHNQTEAAKKQEIYNLLPHIERGAILHLKGKYIKVPQPVRAVYVTNLPGARPQPDLLCLGEDNRWYRATHGDVTEINPSKLDDRDLENISLPDLETLQLGMWRRGDEHNRPLCDRIAISAQPIDPAPEIAEQQRRISKVQQQISKHPLEAKKNPGRLVKLYYDRDILQEQLHKTQIKYQKQQASKSYYWQEFLDLIEILREFAALEGYQPTLLGEAAAIIRGENELWLGLVIMSGELERLEPPYLAAAISALITETLRPDTWCNYEPPKQILEILHHNDPDALNLREIRRKLYQSQTRYEITIPVWLETQLTGLVTSWAQGVPWPELCENTNLDEGDIVRLLRRTVDVLWQIPQIPSASAILKDNAKQAVREMKRFPL
jgi:superfamily II RNA helicase